IILLISLLETSGSVTGMNNMLCSSSGGINSVPMLLSNGMVTISAIIFMARVVFRHLSTFLITGSYIFSRKLLTGFFLSDLNFPFKKNEIKTGASVKTSMASTIIINVFVNARGWKSFPSWPVSINTGRKETIMITVAKNTPLDTCLLDFSITSMRSCWVIQGFSFAFFLNIFLKNFIDFNFQDAVNDIILINAYRHFHS